MRKKHVGGFGDSAFDGKNLEKNENLLSGSDRCWFVYDPVHHEFGGAERHFPYPLLLFDYGRGDCLRVGSVWNLVAITKAVDWCVSRSVEVLRLDDHVDRRGEVAPPSTSVCLHTHQRINNVRKLPGNF